MIGYTLVLILDNSLEQFKKLNLFFKNSLLKSFQSLLSDSCTDFFIYWPLSWFDNWLPLCSWTFRIFDEQNLLVVFKWVILMFVIAVKLELYICSRSNSKCEIQICWQR